MELAAPAVQRQHVVTCSTAVCCLTANAVEGVVGLSDAHAAGGVQASVGQQLCPRASAGKRVAKQPPRHADPN